jgi:hypothetical protein
VGFRLVSAWGLPTVAFWLVGVTPLMSGLASDSEMVYHVLEKHRTIALGLRALSAPGTPPQNVDALLAAAWDWSHEPH